MRRARSVLHLSFLAACSSSGSGMGAATTPGLADAGDASSAPTSDASAGADAATATTTFCERFDDDLAAVKQRWAGVETVNGTLELVEDGVTGRALRSRVLGTGASMARLWAELPTNLMSDVEITFAFRLSREDVVGQDLLSVDLLSQKTGNVFSYVRMHLQNSLALLYFVGGGATGEGKGRLMADGEWHKVRIETHPVTTLVWVDEVEWVGLSHVWFDGSARFHVGLATNATGTPAITDFDDFCVTTRTRP